MQFEDQPVSVVKRMYRCPQCGDGHITFTGSVLLCNPAKYQHYCTKCTSIFSLPERNGDIHYVYETPKAQPAQPLPCSPSPAS